MYSMNLAASLFKKSKVNSIFIRVLQILNIIFQVLIVFLLILAFFMSKSAKRYETDSYVLKKTVFEQRNSKNIDETLRFWQEDILKLSVIKKQIENSSRYGIVMKELGNCLPEDDLIHVIAIEGSQVELILKVNKKRLVKNVIDKEGNKIDVPVDYAALLRKQFENSVCFAGGNINVEYTTSNEKEVNPKYNKISLKSLKLFDKEIKNLPQKPSIAILKVTMKIDERKKNE